MKYAIPLKPEPSKILKEMYGKFDIDKSKPILDIACGYGRNGAFFVDKGYSCIFCDIDEDALNFIINGKNVSINGDIDTRIIQAIQIDFVSEKWIFNRSSVSGIINVHWYDDRLIPYFIDTLAPGGFLYIETMSAHGSNYLQLPKKGFISDLLKDRFSFLYYKERPTTQNGEELRSSVTLLAIKKY